MPLLHILDVSDRISERGEGGGGAKVTREAKNTVTARPHRSTEGAGRRSRNILDIPNGHSTGVVEAAPMALQQVSRGVRLTAGALGFAGVARLASSFAEDGVVASSSNSKTDLR